MKRKLTNNLGLKILSVLIAFVIWLVILNVDDPTITARITGINVRTVNGDSITSAGMYYEVESNDVVSIVVKGKKSIIDTLTASDFYAEADLSKYSITNAVPIEVGLARKYSSEPEIIEGKSQTMMISVENYITRQYEVVIQTKGEPTEGYYISNDEIIASPSRINVSAPESVLKKVAEVKIDVYVNDVSKDFRVIAEPKAYDSNGNIIKTDKIKFGVNSISVTATPLKVKTIDVVVVTEGSLEEGYILTNQESTVEQIDIAGSRNVLDKINKIVLNVDINGFNQSYENVYNLKEYLSGDVKIISDDKECKVSLQVEKLVDKRIEFSAKDIKFLNLRTDVTADYDYDAKMSLTIRGLAGDVEGLGIEQFAPHIDMSKLVIGTQKATVNFENVENIEVVHVPELKITLKEVTEQVITGDNGNAGNTENPENSENLDTGNVNNTDESANTDSTGDSENEQAPTDKPVAEDKLPKADSTITNTEE